MEMLKSISENLRTVKEKSPLVHHLTNYVTVNDCANMVLAVGGSPVMADDIGEVAEMASLASALVINMGTLNKRTIASMILAGQTAREHGIPVIFDPVGIGATTLRTDTAVKIIRETQPAVIRGNMSEIKCLSGLNVQIKGVDSTADEAGGERIAQNLAQKQGCVIAITGATDIISDGSRTCLITNGDKMLSRVTGTGCMTTSLIGTYCGATKDLFLGAASGIMTMGLAGEIACHSLKEAEGIGTFRVRLFDAVFNLSPESLLRGGKISLA
ncbi:hydroxyethylthiazole kinase [Candidatus Formimonas warabiya]|uniref:Hydroxyethylthiazole kinase n=1 Tax=Formimonas warabiya TaxID=1761012 RepID=A0A3G1KUD6_FORW1|nr:hydroxyethylthiazole kinase [Candidatus Formimonas warabiya]ATW26062.1 hydroxyethylthiazole kinase [Candidatus Formimonas warabiya]